MKRTNGQQGFSMVEVLVTMVIIAFGLLGVAGLLTAGLRNNQSSQLRTQASILAYDMAERMRANRAAALNGQYDGTPTDATALSDKTSWNAQLAAKLPSGSGIVETNKPANDLATFQIKIQWSDAKATTAKDSSGNDVVDISASDVVRDSYAHRSGTDNNAAPALGIGEFILRGEI
jgi:type IV pilus assembly protein PilV